jgi:type II secretory pathway pseudopilin PulG
MVSAAVARGPATGDVWLRATRRREAGYNLVILVIAITVLNIMVAAAIPLWRTAIRREKEEELIFRGWQYAEGIRNFQRRFGRLPVRLEELIEVKPRCMRQLWTDPITGKMDWVPVRVGVPGGVTLDQPPGGDGDTPEGDGSGGQGAEQRGNPSTPDGNVGLGPIRGVRSRSKDEAIKSLFNQGRYDQWQFTVELLAENAGAMQGFGVPGQVGLGTRLPTRWLGRPFRPGLNPGVPGAPPLQINPPVAPNPPEGKPGVGEEPPAPGKS